jgi:archaellum component FlaC
LNLFELYAKISVDDSNFKKSMENVQKESKNVAKAMQELQSPLDKAKNTLNAITHPIESARSGFQKLKDATESLRHPIETLKDKVNDASTALETKRNKLSVLASGYDSAKKKVEDLTKEFNKSAKESGTTSKETQELAKKLNEAEKEAEQAKKELNDYSASVSKTSKISETATKSVGNFAGALGKGLGKGIVTTAKVGVAAVGTAAAGIAALTKSAVEGFAEYEQLAGGAQKIFDQMDYSIIEQDAQNAYKTMNISASEYLETMNDVGATFAATMGDEAGYNAAKTGLQAIADYASGTGKSVDVLSEKFTMITRSTSSYQSIADQFSGILPATSKDFLAQAQAAGFLSTKYRELTKVPIAEYQQAVSQMLEKGVADLGLAGNTAAETANTISGSLNAAKAAWSNLIVGIADENANFDELVNNFVETLVGNENGEGGVINNILPRVEVAMEGAGKLVEALIPVIIDKVPTIINEWLPKILNSGISIIKSILDGMVQNQGDIVSGVVTTINTLVSGIMDNLPEILVTGVMLIGQIAAGLIQGLPDLIYKIPEIITDIVNAFAENGDVFLEIGKSIVSGIWNGIVALWNTLVDGLSDLVNGLFGGSSTMTASVNVNGSHAGGLDYVPFDGYIAELHKGERVLTADEARGYNNRSNSGHDERPIKIVVQSVLDGKVIGETAYNYNRRKARAGGT